MSGNVRSGKKYKTRMYPKNSGKARRTQAYLGKGKSLKTGRIGGRSRNSNTIVLNSRLLKTTYVKNADALPRLMLTKFMYTDVSVFSTNAFQTVNSSAIYRLNSPYDPNYAVGGASCQGWGIASTYYGNYMVMGALATIEFNDPSADGIYVGVRFLQNGNNTAVGETLVNLRNTQQTFLKAVNNSGSQEGKFSFYIKPWVLNSKDKMAYKNDPDNGAVPTTNPANDNVLMEVFAINQNASSQTINYTVHIQYYVKLWNRVAI